MGAPLDLGYDVVDVLRRSTAVLTPMVVPEEDRTSTERDRPGVWHGHVSSETHDGGHVDGGPTGAPCLAEVGDGVGGPTEDQNDAAPGRNHREWLVAGVEDERSHFRPRG